MKTSFYENRDTLDRQYECIEWKNATKTEEQLKEYIRKIESDYKSKAIAKAKTFDAVVTYSDIAVDICDIFQEKLRGYSLMLDQRYRWEREIVDKYLFVENAEVKQAVECGAYCSGSDFGHTSPNTVLMLELGFAGLRERCITASARAGLSEEQMDFYNSCAIVLTAIMKLSMRLSEEIAPYDHECAQALSNISKSKPSNIYEAMQLIILYFFSHEYVAGTRVRTLGRLDVLLYSFYKKDLENGTFTKEEIKEFFRYFLNKFSSAKVPFGLPFCLGGLDSDGNEITNELSYLIVDVYNELNIYSPKIHIRVSEKTPRDFLRRILSYIRGGNSSFVFVNDAVAVKALTNVGIEYSDALNYVPIGCYEPAVWGVEVGCTGNGYVNLPKAIEFVLTGGYDFQKNIKCGCDTGKIESHEDFVEEVKKQIAYMTQQATEYIVKIEHYYPQINPDPILSCQYDAAIERGVDLYSGGAKYNNSSMYFYSIASLVDSLMAVKSLVYDEKLLSLADLTEVLKNNWKGNEKLRAKMLRSKNKYGNNVKEADEMAKSLSKYCASLVNNKPNGRGGVFKAALFSINNCFGTGHKTAATPDGRLSGAPLSKNLCAVTAMDRSGITALINSVTEIDHSDFSNGSVLDIILHPSAVKGDDGLQAFLGLLETYISRGGLAFHGNVFSAEQLREAQNDKDKYRTLQVRVCGWNAYFVDLSKEEQDAFIRQAEAMV